ncbi:hypothetical protein KDX31_09290 [Amphritea atlantica]|uniref:Uncharacterized protein n=1 Tax=Amphritea atlantica TaxID=355243 RepID=A0ABY5H0U6_9GAMM|nr:hypothetical protein KDX31_09290 [Amphritea atlantica]
MSKRTSIIWLPALLGIILAVVTKIDLYQFHSQSIDVQTMLSREIPIVLFGMLFAAVVFMSSFYWLLKRNWVVALQSVVSPLIFLVLFGVGGAMGGAFLNAT